MQFSGVGWAAAELVYPPLAPRPWWPQLKSPKSLSPVTPPLRLCTALFMSTLPLGGLAAAPQLWCELHFASEVRTFHQSVVDDPYAAIDTTLDGRFTFRSVVLGRDQQIESITLSVFDLAAAHAPMIQQTRLLPPFNTQPELPALTGWHLAYSSVLGSEFRFGCALRPAVPDEERR